MGEYIYIREQMGGFVYSPSLGAGADWMNLLNS